jgi:hypothetical protein
MNSLYLISIHSISSLLTLLNSALSGHRLLFLIACISIFFTAPRPLSAQSEITVQAEPVIVKMMERFVAKGKAEENIKAWRIQIITTDNRREMEQARATFLKMYPDTEMEWKHIAPYYQVRVGYFEKKQHLMPFLLELKIIFPAATPVYDNVSKRSLVNK